jgi:hypothetical protein
MQSTANVALQAASTVMAPGTFAVLAADDAACTSQQCTAVHSGVDGIDAMA